MENSALVPVPSADPEEDLPATVVTTIVDKTSWRTL